MPFTLSAAQTISGVANSYEVTGSGNLTELAAAFSTVGCTQTGYTLTFDSGGVARIFAVSGTLTEAREGIWTIVIKNQAHVCWAYAAASAVNLGVYNIAIKQNISEVNVTYDQSALGTGADLYNTGTIGKCPVGMGTFTLAAGSISYNQTSRSDFDIQTTKTATTTFNSCVLAVSTGSHRAHFFTNAYVVTTERTRFCARAPVEVTGAKLSILQPFSTDVGVRFLNLPVSNIQRALKQTGNILDTWTGASATGTIFSVDPFPLYHGYSGQLNSRKSILRTLYVSANTPIGVSIANAKTVVTPLDGGTTETITTFSGTVSVEVLQSTVASGVAYTISGSGWTNSSNYNIATLAFGYPSNAVNIDVLINNNILGINVPYIGSKNNLIVTPYSSVVTAPFGFTYTGSGLLTVASFATALQCAEYLFKLAYDSPENMLWKNLSHNPTNFVNEAYDFGAIGLTGIEFISGSVKSSGSLIANSAIQAGSNIVGNVTQATPTHLTGVTITGNLTYNTNTPITVTFTNTTVSGTVSNSGTGAVSVNLVNSTVTTGANVTAQYPITISDADNRLTSFHVWAFNSEGTLVFDTTFQSQVASVTVDMPVGGSLRVYSQPYGYISRITNTASTSPTLRVSHVPETMVDTTLDTIVRNQIESHFSSVVENALLYVEADTDLAQYTPAQALNGLHYFIVNRGFLFSASSLLINSVDSVKLIDGGFRVYNAGFRGRAKSTLNATNTPSLFITLPLYIEDASGVAGNQVFVRNANGIAIVSALWTKATANISNNDINSIATRVDQSVVLAKEATVSAKASQASVTALGSPMQASAYVYPDNTGIADIKSKTDKLVFNSQNHVASNIHQIQTAPLTDIRSGLATLTNVTDAQTAIVAEVNANETKIDAIKTETAAIKTKTDSLQNTDLTAVNTALTDIKGVGYDATKHNLVKIKQQASLAAALSA